jgi:peptidoglycan/LPS O-acetylase OafA/YrhL
MEWFGYALSDFLLFAPETYWRLFERTNTSLWPLHVPLMLALIALTSFAVRGWPHAALVLGLGLAMAWALISYAFLETHYLPINWVIASVIPLAWAQVVLLIVLGPGLRFDPRHHARLALGLVALAMVYPFIGLAMGRPIAQAEVAGLSPDPTAILTLGLLGLAHPGYRRQVLSILPSCWCALSAITLLAMDEPTGWLLLCALAAAIAMLLQKRGPVQTPN